MMKYLYVFIDVSGNYDFSPGGTKYIVVTSILCDDLDPGTLELYKLKHELIDEGVDLEYFHAAEDRQSVRNRVFDILSTLGHLRIDSIVVEKKKTGPSLQPIRRFYPMMIENLLKYPFDPRGIDAQSFDKVFIFMDRESARLSEREALKKAIRVYIARYLGNIPYVLCMHQSGTHPYLQLVDYCSWAIYVKWERGENRPYRKIKQLIRSEFPIFRYGVADWY